jgi:hypothetical protein
MKFYASGYSNNSPKGSLVWYQIRIKEMYIFQGDIRNIKPLYFDGEREKEDDVESWLLEIENYLQLEKYSSNLESIIDTYHWHVKDIM